MRDLYGQSSISLKLHIKSTLMTHFRSNSSQSRVLKVQISIGAQDTGGNNVGTFARKAMIPVIDARVRLL
jgi:hypothetical protein